MEIVLGLQRMSHINILISLFDIPHQCSYGVEILLHSLLGSWAQYLSSDSEQTRVNFDKQ
jgi:hypothetical protein